MGAHPEIDTSTLDHIKRLAQNQADLSRAVSHGQPALRDPSGNILALDPTSATPLLAAQGHDVALNLREGTLHVMDESGSNYRNMQAATVTSDGVQTTTVNASNVFATTNGTHFGEVGSTSVAYAMWGTLHGFLDGDSNGTHYGPTSPQVQGPVGPPGPPGPVGPKGFVVDHPTDPRRWLVHACTEAPHNGVEYWGTATLIDGFVDVELPPYFESLTETGNRSVHLTATAPPDRTVRDVIDTPVLSATYPTGGRFRIFADGPGNIDVWWLVKAVRKDLPALLVEPRRSEVTVSGFGPYRTYSPVANKDGSRTTRQPSGADQTAGMVRVLWTALGIEQARVDSLAEVVDKLVTSHNGHQDAVDTV